jgi:hypothetical protein
VVVTSEELEYKSGCPQARPPEAITGTLSMHFPCQAAPQYPTTATPARLPVISVNVSLVAQQAARSRHTAGSMIPLPKTFLELYNPDLSLFGKGPFPGDKMPLTRQAAQGARVSGSCLTLLTKIGCANKLLLGAVTKFPLLTYRAGSMIRV